MMYDDMPPAVDPDAYGGGGGGFIPPPLGATVDGHAGGYDPFPGANRPLAWPSYPSHTSAAQSPWGGYQRPQSYPYTESGHYRASTPPLSWGAQTPGGSWGGVTPAGSWGPATPLSASFSGGPFGSLPWSNQPHISGSSGAATAAGFHTPALGSASMGQPLTASPWFNSGQWNSDKYPFGRSQTTKHRGRSKSRPREARARSHSRPRHPVDSDDEDWGNAFERYWENQQGFFGSNRGASGRTTSQEMLPSASPTSFPPARSRSSLGRSNSTHGPEQYSSKNLAKRPRDWRPDYDPRPSFVTLPKASRARSDVAEWNDPIKRKLHGPLSYSSRNPNIYWDLRFDPSQPGSVDFNRRLYPTPPFHQIPFDPPINQVRLYHPRLPWYLDIVASQPELGGVTLSDVLYQAWRKLNEPIGMKHWYNEELDDEMRAKISNAYKERCLNYPWESPMGVKKVDFLRSHVIFEGLVRGKNGIWEMKTRQAD